MGAVGFLGQVASLDLVFALGPRFDPLQPLGDGVVDGLVVAGFEVQELEARRGPPIAAVKCLVIAQVQGGGHREVVVLDQDEHHRIAETVAQEMKELARQIGPDPTCGPDVER